MSIALLELLSQPQNRLGSHLCAKVSIEGGRSATLQSGKDRQGVSLITSRSYRFSSGFLAGGWPLRSMSWPAACVRERSYGSQRRLCPPLSTGWRWSQWCSWHYSSRSYCGMNSGRLLSRGLEGFGCMSELYAYTEWVIAPFSQQRAGFWMHTLPAQKCIQVDRNICCTDGSHPTTTHLRIKPLFTVVFIFSTRCSTFTCGPSPQITIRTHHCLRCGDTNQVVSSAHLQVSNAEFFLIDVGGVSPGSQAGHGGQVATVSAHSLHDEHTALGPGCRLLDSVTGLREKRTKKCSWLGIFGIYVCLSAVEAFTEVMVLRAVSAPMLKSEPGTLLDTVAGITTMGMHISSYFSLAWTSSRPPTNACSRGRRWRSNQGQPTPTSGF